MIKKNPSLNKNPWLTGVSLAVILVIAFFTLSPTLNNGFTNWDDPDYVLENTLIKELSLSNIKGIFSTFISGNYHPLTILSFAIEYHFFKLDPKMYHLNSLILHLINILLVYWLIFLITQKPITSFVAALLFGIHPLQVEAVCWTSSRKDVLYALFYLGAVISYVFYIKDNLFRKKFILICFALYLLSFLSKPQAASLPFLLLVFDLFLERKWDRKVLLEKIPFWALIPVFATAAYFGQRHLGSIQDNSYYNFVDRVLFASWGLLAYLAKFIAPVKLSCFYPYPDKANNALPLAFILSPFVLVIFIFAFAKTKKLSKNIFFGFLFFFTAVFFNLKFIGVGGFIIADRYMYIPAIGLSFVIGECFHALLSKKIGDSALIPNRIRALSPIFLLFAYTVALASISSSRTQVWEDSHILWSDVISKYPSVAVAYHNRGNFYRDETHYDLAIDDFNKSIALDPHQAQVYNNRGIAFSKNNMISNAMADYDRALEIDPNYALSYNNRGIEYLETQQYRLALADFNKAIQLEPHHPKIYVNKGKVYEKLKKLDLAEREFTKALDLDPRLNEAYSLRGALYFRTGKIDLAIADFSQEIAITNNSSLAFNNRGSAYGKKGQYALAIADFTQALILDPDNPFAYYNRGNAYRKEKQCDLAIADFDEVLALDPNDAKTYHRRSYCYYEKKEYGKALQDALRARSLGREVDELYIKQLQVIRGQRPNYEF